MSNDRIDLLREYREKYGSIDRDYNERIINQLLDSKIKNIDIIKIREEIKRILNRKWERLNFIFFLKPAPTPRPRMSFRRGRMTTFVKGAKDNKDIFDEFILAVKTYPIITTPCKLYIEIFSPVPSSMNKIEKILAELKLIDNISRPDWDNLGKAYSDMIQKTLIYDDSLIVESRVRKKYSSKPRVEIIIEYVESHDCKYNSKKVDGWFRETQSQEE